MNLGELTADSAKPLEGTSFEVQLDDGRTVQMKLEEVALFPIPQRRRRGPQPKRVPFSLFFIGTPGIVLPQGLYTLRAPECVLEGLFIVPVGKDDTDTEYEAVFT